MTNEKLTCAKAPCKSCPYRKDVPSGVWAVEEYDKLPDYDGTIGEQLMKGAVGRFDCHQQDGKICAGWLGSHGPSNLLAMRLQGAHIDPEVWDYKSPVPLFTSGAEAREHGIKKIANPDEAAERTIKRLLRKRRRNLKR